jgi:hypothetical protein
VWSGCDRAKPDVYGRSPGIREEVKVTAGSPDGRLDVAQQIVREALCVKVPAFCLPSGSRRRAASDLSRLLMLDILLSLKGRRDFGGSGEAIDSNRSAWLFCVGHR